MARKSNDFSEKLQDALSEVKAEFGKDTVRTFDQQVDTDSGLD